MGSPYPFRVSVALVVKRALHIHLGAFLQETLSKVGLSVPAGDVVKLTLVPVGIVVCQTEFCQFIVLFPDFFCLGVGAQSAAHNNVLH